jgi:hypothetical protein
MKSLSVRQPWAGLIVAGHKSIENRSRHTTYRGPLLIYASRRRVRRTLVEVAHEYDVTLTDELIALCSLVGGIIGVASIVDCVSASTSKWFDWTTDSEGRRNWGYVLGEARPLPFRTARHSGLENLIREQKPNET